MITQTEQYATRTTVLKYAEEMYGTMPEQLWMKYPLYSVLRRADNKKWYAVIMNVPWNKLGFDLEESVDILVIKCDEIARQKLLFEKGFLPAYHMNRKNWITVLLDGTVNQETVCRMLDESYAITLGKH